MNLTGASRWGLRSSLFLAVGVAGYAALESGCAGLLGVSEIEGAGDGSSPQPDGGGASAEAGSPETGTGTQGDGGTKPACTCGSGLVCERSGGATACEDPAWAEWPMPNGAADVAGGAPNAEAYSDNQDGTVTETVTGLTWQKAPAGSLETGAPTAYTQSGAATYCKDLRLGGYVDWRLPSMIELLSLEDLSNANPVIDPTAFPGTPPGGGDGGTSSDFWSQTAFAGSDPSCTASAPCAWALGFDTGYIQYGAAATTYVFARCVR